MMGAPHVVEVDWSTNFVASGWRPVLGGSRFLFWKPLLRRVPKNCRDEHVLDRLRTAVGHEFIEWWLKEAGGPDVTCFGLRFPATAGVIPWEVLIGILKPATVQRTSIVRRLKATQPTAPERFTEPLRMLIVQGAANDPNDSTVATLALEQERKGLLDAWALLNKEVREGVMKPEVCQQPLAEVSKVVKDWQPHVLVFSGHGRVRKGSDGDSELLMSDGQWLPGRQFAQAIGTGARYPAFVMLWACDTGRDERPRPGTWAPGLAQTLLDSGSVAVLAMQDPINDWSAILLGRECLTLLAQGVPLDRSVAGVRAKLLTECPELSHPMDWAAPIIWSASSIVPAIKWASPAPDLAERQLAAARLLRGTFDRAGELLTLASADEELKADGWAIAGHTLVIGQSDIAEHSYRWARLLQIMQVRQQLVVLAIELRSANLEIALREWAERVHEYTLPNELPQPFGERIRELRRNTRDVWAQLCAMPDCLLALALPAEPLEEAPWFWGPLTTAQGGSRCTVLSGRQLPDATTWDMDNLERIHMEPEAIIAAIGRAGRLVRALAALNTPVPTAYIEVESNDGPRMVRDWPEATELTIGTGYGTVLRSSVRQTVLRASSPSELALGCRDAVAVLSDGRVRQTIELRERRLSLLLGGGLLDEALVEAADLAVLRRQQEQPRLVLALLRSLDEVNPGLKFSLPARGKLMVASANLSLGAVDDANFWLDQANAQEVLEQALAHALRAEAEKSSTEVGARDQALAEIEEAIALCRREWEQGNRSRELASAYRSYRQDLARILHYLFYDRDGAKSRYEELLVEWRDDPDAVIDRAIVTRNYAECLRVLSRNDTAALETSVALLRQSINDLRTRSSAPALAELHYELAKTVAAGGNQAVELAELRACEAAAVRSGYDMLLALVRNRRFWRFKEFSSDLWQQRAEALEQFVAHGWAARALINGRIAAASKLLGFRNAVAAIAELEQAQAMLERFHSFNQGSDRWRRAVVAAGLDLSREGTVPGAAWREFLTTASWAGEWLTAEGLIPERVWDTWNERNYR